MTVVLISAAACRRWRGPLRSSSIRNWRRRSHSRSRATTLSVRATALWVTGRRGVRAQRRAAVANVTARVRLSRRHFSVALRARLSRTKRRAMISRARLIAWWASGAHGPDVRFHVVVVARPASARPLRHQTAAGRALATTTSVLAMWHLARLIVLSVNGPHTQSAHTRAEVAQRRARAGHIACTSMVASHAHT